MTKNRKRVLWTISLVFVLVLTLTAGALVTNAAGTDLTAKLAPTVPTVPTTPVCDVYLNEYGFDGSNDGFIELYLDASCVSSPFDLTGWKLTIDPVSARGAGLTAPDAIVYTIPSGSITAGGFFVVTATDMGLTFPAGGVIVQLLTPDGQLIDTLQSPSLGTGQSVQRIPDGTGALFLYCDETKDATNLGATCGTPTAVDLAGMSADSGVAQVQWFALAGLLAVVALAGVFGWRRYQQTV